MVGLVVLLFFVLDTVLPQGEWEPWGENGGEKRCYDFLEHYYFVYFF